MVARDGMQRGLLQYPLLNVTPVRARSSTWGVAPREDPYAASVSALCWSVMMTRKFGFFMWLDRNVAQPPKADFVGALALPPVFHALGTVPQPQFAGPMFNSSR